MPKLNSRGIKFVSKDSRHVRWNWEMSPDNMGNARYHIIVVDDKNRKGKIRRVIQQLQKYSSVENMRSFEGRVRDSKLMYLFESFDSLIRPEMVDWSKVSDCVVQDERLYERIHGRIEDFVAGFYGG